MRKAVTSMAVLLLLLPSCRFMPIYEKDKSVKLELALDLSSDLEDNAIAVPEHFMANFYGWETGMLSNTHFVGSEGGDVTIAPGTYTLLVYTFGTEYVQIRGESSLETIEAFTSDITASKMKSYRRFSTKAMDDPIVYTPDHLLVAKEEVTVQEFTGENRAASMHADASTVVQTFVFEMTQLTGLEYVESAEAFVTNQCRSYFIGRGEASDEPCTIWFPVEVNREEGTLTALFNTFGVRTGEDSKTYVHFIMRDTGGDEHNYSMDITEKVVAPRHVIEIEEEIDIPQPEGTGSFSPEVNPWEKEEIDVPIG